MSLKGWADNAVLWQVVLHVTFVISAYAARARL